LSCPEIWNLFLQHYVFLLKFRVVCQEPGKQLRKRVKLRIQGDQMSLWKKIAQNAAFFVEENIFVFQTHHTIRGVVIFYSAGVVPNSQS
jgi:hypothetical protein